MARSPTEQPRGVWCCSTCGAIYHKDFPRCPADGAEVVMAERDPLLGAIVGHYRIDRLIGEGGMGRVYLAHHARLPNKHYAFKVLLGDHSASIAMRARFTREAERASQLDHPNVVRVVDFGQTRHGLLYIAMDYVEGPSLVSLIGKTPMPPARVIALTRAICKGLVYAHAAGIVHRDLKPENILVTSRPDGEVPRIVDFGLALSIDQSDARLTESGMTMGTPAFAAPEQLSGKPIDHRADLYALGMSMFEMLTGGMTPFEGHMMEVVSARTSRDAPRPSERAPALAIPRELDEIVARLTRRKPADRYQSAGEVIEALDRIRLGRIRLGRIRLGRERRSTEQTARNRSRRRWIAMALVAAGGLAATVWYVRAAHDGAPARLVAPPRVTTAPTSAALAPAAVTPAPGAASAIASDVPDAELTKPRRSAPTAAPSKRRPPRERAARPVHGASPGVAEPAKLAVVPPPAPAELQTRIDRVDVTGSLPVREVQRAVERRRSAIERCMPGAPETVVARFTIGETRRARGVRAAGPTATTNACVATAITDVRTEAAPDVGDVEVTVRIAFVVKT